MPDELLQSMKTLLVMIRALEARAKYRSLIVAQYVGQSADGMVSAMQQMELERRRGPDLEAGR